MIFGEMLHKYMYSHITTYRFYRIPNVSLLGYEEGTGEMLLYNFWKDSKVSILGYVIISMEDYLLN
jgi:hypothetical protein